MLLKFSCMSFVSSDFLETKVTIFRRARQRICLKKIKSNPLRASHNSTDDILKYFIFQRR